MVPTLPDLPAELLLNIIDSEVTPSTENCCSPISKLTIGLSSENDLLFRCYLLSKREIKLKALTTLELGFGKSGQIRPFFKYFSTALQLSQLQNLVLRDLITRFKFMKTLLETCNLSLKTIRLEHIELATTWWDSLFEYIEEMDLEEVTLRCLNYKLGDDDKMNGVGFKDIALERPEFFDDENCLIDNEPWLLIHNGEVPISWIKIQSRRCLEVAGSNQD